MQDAVPKAPLRVSVGELSWSHAKHGSMTEGAAVKNCLEACTSANPHHLPTTAVIARPKAVAIRIPCGAKHRPSPSGTERERIATSGYALLAMTWKFSPGPSDDRAGAATPGGVALRSNLSVILRLWNCCHRRAVSLPPPPTMNGGAGDDRKGRPYAQRCEIGPCRERPPCRSAVCTEATAAPRRIRITFPLPLSLRGRRPWQSVLFPVPLGTGRCFASQGLRIATSLRSSQ